MFGKKKNLGVITEKPTRGAWYLESRYIITKKELHTYIGVGNSASSNENIAIDTVNAEFYFPTYEDAVAFKADLEQKGKSYQDNMSYMIAAVEGISLFTESHRIEKVTLELPIWEKLFLRH
jgi:hypothetical protein